MSPAKCQLCAADSDVYAVPAAAAFRFRSWNGRQTPETKRHILLLLVLLFSCIMKSEQMTLNSKSSILGGACWEVYGKGRLMLIVFLTVCWLCENMSDKRSYAKVMGQKGPCSTLSIPVSESEQERGFPWMSFEEQSYLFRNEREIWKEAIKPESPNRCLEGFVQGKDMMSARQEGMKERPCARKSWSVICPYAYEN